MKKQYLYILILFFTQTFAVAEAADWRKTASDKQKLDNVVKVIPGASNIMLQMGERYKNIYWAVKQEKWKFAEYQIEEMEELIKTLIITRPKRAATARQFLKDAFSEYPQAFKNKDWQSFSKAFENMRQRCMQCHVQNKHAFITLNKKPAKGNSPVLD